MVEILDLKKNDILSVSGWYNEKPIILFCGSKYCIEEGWQPATKAEIEAHKLGFHIGDSVDLIYLIKNGKLYNPAIIKSFGYNLKGLVAYLEEPFNYFSVENIDHSIKGSKFHK